MRREIEHLIDEEIIKVREENGEGPDTPEEDCLGPEEAYRIARDRVLESIG